MVSLGRVPRKSCERFGGYWADCDSLGKSCFSLPDGTKEPLVIFRKSSLKEKTKTLLCFLIRYCLFFIAL